MLNNQPMRPVPTTTRCQSVVSSCRSGVSRDVPAIKMAEGAEEMFIKDFFKPKRRYTCICCAPDFLTAEESSQYLNHSKTKQTLDIRDMGSGIVILSIPVSRTSKCVQRQTPTVIYKRVRNVKQTPETKLHTVHWTESNPKRNASPVFHPPVPSTAVWLMIPAEPNKYPAGCISDLGVFASRTMIITITLSANDPH